MDVLYTATATATGGRDGAVRSSDGVIDMVVKPPKELGGPDEAATNPEQLFAAGYSACYLNALSLIARSQKISAKQFTVTADVDLGPDGSGFGIGVALRCHMPGVEPDTAAELVRRAHEVCPYSRATQGNIEVALYVEDQRVN